MDQYHLWYGKHVHIDNLYTSPKLFKDLYIQNIGACVKYRDCPSVTTNALTRKSCRGTVRWIRDGLLVEVGEHRNSTVLFCIWFSVEVAYNMFVLLFLMFYIRLPINVTNICVFALHILFLFHIVSEVLCHQKPSFWKCEGGCHQVIRCLVKTLCVFIKCMHLVMIEGCSHSFTCKFGHEGRTLGNQQDFRDSHLWVAYSTITRMYSCPRSDFGMTLADPFQSTLNFFLGGETQKVGGNLKRVVFIEKMC